MFSEKGRASLAFPRTSPFLSNGFCSVGKGEPYFVFLQKWRLSVSLPLKKRNVFKERAMPYCRPFFGLTGKAVKRDSIMSKVLGEKRGSPSPERFPFPSLSLSPPKTFAFIESLLVGFPADGMPGVLFWGRAFFQGSGAVLAGWRNMEKGLVEPPCAVDKGGCFRAL